MRQDPISMLRAMADIPEAVDPAVLRWWSRQAGLKRARRVDTIALMPKSPPTAYADHVFLVELEQLEGEGWYTLAGVRAGPFASPELLEADLLERIARWRAAAKERGGYVWRRTALEFVATLPRGVAVEGALPLTKTVRRPA